ncbi:MAG TPA: helix-turn-helix domain-containing protein [Candidatus Nanoarchaeia archaeon]|nr:helix-turn-helix domain-containing protein [Candidatus Nanoarchaeia archaeon]
MEISTLLDIGLTKGEARVYLALMRLGPTKTGRLASTAGVSSSKVYKILDRLEKKGLVGHVLRQKIKYFAAVSPRRIIDYLSEKEQEFQKKKVLAERLIPLLEIEGTLHEPQDEAAIYEGFKAVKNLFETILDDLQNGETYCVIGAGYTSEIPAMRAFFQRFHTERAEKGVKVKMLANSNIKNTIVPATGVISEIRFLPEYLITNMQITFYKETAFIILWVKQPKGFLIKNAEAVKSFQAYFDVFWNIAKR